MWRGQVIKCKNEEVKGKSSDPLEESVIVLVSLSLVRLDLKCIPSSAPPPKQNMFLLKCNMIDY